MERIINKIIGSFRKKYFLVTFIFTMIIIVMSGSYSYWASESGWQKATELTYQNLSYSITINNVATTTISSAANSGTVYYDVEITSLNDINTKYLLVYNSSAAGLTFEVSSFSKNDSTGIIGAYVAGDDTNKTRTIRIGITNNTANASTITLNVLGGYSWNLESTISIPNGYYKVSGYKVETTFNYGLTLAEEVNLLLSCTPTASSPCLYSGNANNYVSYGGKTWRILGSYIINSENVLKLILDNYSTNSVSYSNTAGELSTFYSSLTDTSLVRTSSPFVCTGTTSVSCTGSANFGMLSKTEYDLIGGSNSYLYTKPDKPYWTNTESSSGVYYVGKNKGTPTLSGTSIAYVKPVIYLKSNTVRNVNTKGTISDPFQIKAGYYLTVTANSGTTKFLSGYYGSGYTYTDNTPTRTNYQFRDYVTTGTGTSMNSYTLTMGSGASTLTLRWWAVYTIAYNCNGGSGSTSSSSHVENVAKNLTANGCINYRIVSGATGAVYKYLGWSTNSGATSPTYTNQQSVTGLTSVGGSTITLYAIYSSNILSYGQSYYVTDEGSGNWNIQYKTVGTNNLTVSNAVTVDFYVLSGGAGGSGGVGSYRGGGGGGSGYATTVSNYTISAGTYSLTIGDGGAGSAGGSYAGGGGGYQSNLFGYAPAGGYGSSGDHRNGGNGASGGGRGTYSSGNPKPGDGGSDGSDGLYGTGFGSVGVGQHSTTRSFGEAGGILLAGGGGGGGYASSKSSASSGGAGGGGGGGWYGAGGAATANTGGGGGGGGAGQNGGAGGSGIIIIRNHR